MDVRDDGYRAKNPNLLTDEAVLDPIRSPRTEKVEHMEINQPWTNKYCVA